MSSQEAQAINARLDRIERLTLIGAKDVLDIDWKISRIRSAGNCKKCPLKKRSFQRTLCVC